MVRQRAPQQETQASRAGGRVRPRGSGLTYGRNARQPRVTQDSRGNPIAAPTKYGNQRTVIDGILFHSKLEARYYAYLRALREAGALENFHRQVIIDLGGGVKHVVDYLLLRFKPDGYEYVEIKGFDSPASKAKRRIAEDRLGREIKVLTRADIDALSIIG